MFLTRLDVELRGARSVVVALWHGRRERESKRRRWWHEWAVDSLTHGFGRPRKTWQASNKSHPRLPRRSCSSSSFSPLCDVALGFAAVLHHLLSVSDTSFCLSSFHSSPKSSTLDLRNPLFLLNLFLCAQPYFHSPSSWPVHWFVQLLSSLTDCSSRLGFRSFWG
jgi:hypothetical protein